MKNFADISSFESLAHNANSTPITNATATMRVRNSVFSNGASGDIDRALLAQRALYLLKQGQGIMTMLLMSGVPIMGTAINATGTAIMETARAIKGVWTGHPDSAFSRSIRSARDGVSSELGCIDDINDISDLLISKGDTHLNKIARLRAIKAKGKR